MDLSEGIKGRVDPQPTAEQFRVALPIGVAEDRGAIEQDVPNRLGEIGPSQRSRRQRLDPLGNHERRRPVEQSIGLGDGDEFICRESIDDLSEARPTAFGVGDGVISRRRADQAGEEPRLDEREVLNRLAEVGLGSRRNPIGVVPEKHGVEIALDDLFFGNLTLEAQRVDDLEQLVTAIALEAGKVVVLDDLHGDRRCALLRSIGGEVRQRGTEQTADVDSSVHPIATVFDTQKRRNDMVGNLIEGHRLAVLEFVDGDLVAERVVHIGALCQFTEFRKSHRPLIMGIGHLPQTRGHAHDGCGDEQRRRSHHQGETGDPGQP